MRSMIPSRKTNSATDYSVAVLRPKMWAGLRIHKRACSALCAACIALCEETNLTTGVPEDNCLVGAEPASADVRDEPRHRFRAVGVVHKQRFGARSQRLCLVRGRRRHTIALA